MIKTPFKKGQHEPDFQEYSRNSRTSRNFFGSLRTSPPHDRKRGWGESSLLRKCLQAAFGVVIARPALMNPSPPRPGQEPAYARSSRKDQAGEQMAHFRAAQRKQDGTLWGNRWRGCLGLRANRGQVGCRQQHQGHMSI